MLTVEKGSLLKYIDAEMNGVNVPWLYIGMLFSSFCWHFEVHINHKYCTCITLTVLHNANVRLFLSSQDNSMSSINYCHMGDSKQWYGIPCASAREFEQVCVSIVAICFRVVRDTVQCCCCVYDCMHALLLCCVSICVYCALCDCVVLFVIV